MRILAILILFLLPAPPSSAEIHFVVHADSCLARSGGSPVRGYFSIDNLSTPAGICRVELIPEPKPVTEACRMSACGTPNGSCGLTEVGGAEWILDGGACIGPGTTQGGFTFEIDAGPCCYFVGVYGPAGQFYGGYEECFCFDVVQATSATWGRVKAIHR